MMAHATQTEIQAYPLQWPIAWKRTASRTRAIFGRKSEKTFKRGDGSTGSYSTKSQLSIADSRDRLLRELNLLGARRVVINSNLRLRNDGQPLGAQREPDDPGVCVYFQLSGNPRCLPCDRWDRAGDNLAAIAKFVEAMRGQIRWGVGSVDVAFSGFKALPGGGEPIIPPQPMSLREAAVAIQDLVAGAFSYGPIMEAAVSFQSAYRDAAKRHHPDFGGLPTEWARLQQAAEVLKRHHGVA